MDVLAFLFGQDNGQNMKLVSINTGLILSYRHYFIWLYVFNFPCFSWPVNSKKTVVSFSSKLTTNVQTLMCVVYSVVGKKRSQCHSLLHYHTTFSKLPIVGTFNYFLNRICTTKSINSTEAFITIVHTYIVFYWALTVSSLDFSVHNSHQTRRNRSKGPLSFIKSFNPK